MRQRDHFSCADCGVVSCDGPKGAAFPAKCMTTQMDEAVKARAMAAYQSEETAKIMKTAALVEYEGYGLWSRVQETVAFAERMGYEKIGIATCVGLIRETRAFAKILRSHGFSVFGIGCKAGATPKTEVGIPAQCEEIGANTCNPILQATMLNEAETQLNVVVGLCVGHDSLFYRHAKAPTTTLIVKDRVTGHNPAAVLYTLESYYGKVKGEEP